MAKPLFQDIIPPDKRSIKRIPVPPRRGERHVPVPERRVEEPREAKMPRRREVRKGRGFFRVFLTLLAVIAIGAAAFFFASQASGGRVLITPRQNEVAVDAQFSASSTPDTSGLAYQTMTIMKDGKLTVTATGEERADTKASGTIIVYNDYNSEPQTLVANTRFQTPQGLIFRTPEKIIVPGKKVENGKSVPGSIEIKIIADKPGPDYNLALTDFTIPGFKGDPKFSKFYGRSKTPTQGGFSGMRPKVEESKVSAARDKIKSELEASLLRQSEKDIPEGYIMPTGAYFISYESLENNGLPTGNVEISERATFHGIIFKKADLAAEIAKKTNGGKGNPADNMIGTKSLMFATKAASSTSPWANPTINFTLRGTTTLVSAVDTEKLKDELAGKPRKSLNAILAGYPSVARAQVTIRPFWKSSFPANKDEIEIVLAESQLSQ